MILKQLGRGARPALKKSYLCVSQVCLVPSDLRSSNFLRSRRFSVATRRRQIDTESSHIQTPHATPELRKNGKNTDTEKIPPESVQDPKPDKDPTPTQDQLLSEQTVSNKEQRKADWAIIKRMSKYLWPKDDPGARFRVGASVGLLIGAKVKQKFLSILARRCT